MNLFSRERLLWRSLMYGGWQRVVQASGVSEPSGPVLTRS